MTEEQSVVRYRIFTILTYLLTFIFGLYFGQIKFPTGGFEPITLDTESMSLASSKGILSAKNKSYQEMTTIFELGTYFQADKVGTHHYDGIYEKNLKKFIGKNLTFLEIGLGCGMPLGPGASAHLWRAYFGPQAEIHFVEYNRPCGEEWYKKEGVKLNVKMHYGSQEDVSFLNTIDSIEGGFDVIVDDGGHTMIQQQASFTNLLSKVRRDGIYFIEDLLTSYMQAYGGGYHRQTTTIEFIKRFIDDIQKYSPEKSSKLPERILSFEISNKIVAFNVK